jgi:hypothetical protein
MSKRPLNLNQNRLNKPVPGIKDGNNQFLPPPPFRLADFLFDKQLRFVEDPHSFKIAVCSRRSGKSVACAADLMHTAMTAPDTVSLYITLSRNNAKKLVWPEMKRINREYKLGAIEDATELSLTFPNRSVIYLSGAKDKSEIEKFRGLALKKCYIDECQSFREYIRELIDDIISPALMDYAGTLVLIGTPGPVPTGYFHECAVVSDTWTQYGWTFFDNPFISQKSGMTHEQLLNRELKRRGVKIDDPSIQREFFGKWVLDSDSLWVKYSAKINDYDILPDSKYNYILGIDLGFDDADALAVLAWTDQSPITYLVHESVVPKQGITELVDEIRALQARYEISKMVIDQGGLGKKIAEEIRRRHHIPVQPADKIRKQENVALLNDALRSGRFKAKANSVFAQDSLKVEIDRSKSTPDRIVVADKFHSDIIDAVLYAFRESPSFSYEPPAIPPVPGSTAWAKEEADRMFEEAQNHFSALENLPSDDDLGFD